MTNAQEQQTGIIEAIEFVKYIYDNDWQWSRENPSEFNIRAGNLIHGNIIKTISVFDLYKEFKSASPSLSSAKSPEQCKNEVAVKNGFPSWDDFLLRIIILLGEKPKAPSPKMILKNKLSQYENEAMLLYAQSSRPIMGEGEKKEIALSFVKWILKEEIDLVDGDFYWAGDSEGDNPMSEEELYEKYKKVKANLKP